MQEVYKLCYIENNKAWFTNNFEEQWGDDWGDKLYEINAGEPYNHYYKNKQECKIKHEILYFELPDYDNYLPCDRGLYSVEDMKNRLVDWIYTKDFIIPAGTSIENFVDIIKKHKGIIYLKHSEIIKTNTNRSWKTNEKY